MYEYHARITVIALWAAISVACAPPSDPGCVAGRECHGASTGGPGGIFLSTGPGSLDLPDALALSCASVELIETHLGCRFWAVDLPNAWLPSDPASLDVAAEQPFAVTVTNATSGAPAQVSVYVGAGDAPIDAATVSPGQVHSFVLPQQNVDPSAGGGSTAYRIESDRPIAAYQFQPLGDNIPVYSNDATALFPEHVLGSDYMAITGDAAMLAMVPPGSFETVAYNAGAFVTVVATEDDTRVQIYPTAGLIAPGETSLLLGRGQAYTVLSDLMNPAGSATGDLSGSRFIADKRVAVFSGAVTTGVPIDSDACCADHLEHQMLPLWAWGSAYIVAPPPSAVNGDHDAPGYYRIVGAFADTALEWPLGRPEGAPELLQIGETRVFRSDRPFLVRSTPETPFALAQFLMSSHAADPGGSGLGDPSMTIIPAVDQMQPEYVFVVPQGYAANHLSVVAPADATLTLDAAAVQLTHTLGDNDGVTYAYASVPVAPGSHVLAADRPMQITVVGYDRYVSYAYTGGSGVSPLSDLPPAP